MAYVYCADVYCSDCGARIKKWLDKAEQTPEHPEDETIFDSDDYPKWCDDDEESDSPQHCASHGDCINVITLESGYKIGCLIGTCLTTDGVDYIKERIAEGGEVAEFWKKEFGDYL
jgi:hypothetical protein